MHLLEPPLHSTYPPPVPPFQPQHPLIKFMYVWRINLKYATDIIIVQYQSESLDSSAIPQSFV